MDIVVGIVAQRENDQAHRLAATLVETLESDGVDAIVDENIDAPIDAAGAPVSTMADCDFVVSIGGDGTLLFVAREAEDTPILGVNLGEVGFLNAVAPSDAVDAVTELVATIRETGRLESRAVDRLRASGDGWELEPALNEVVVHGPKRGPCGGVDVDVRVNGNRYASSRADGVLVATQTGSTAYNLSEGGPLVTPAVDALVVTQMCASSSMPPLVVDRESELALSVSGSDAAYAISDGRDRRRLEPPETVTVEIADDPIRLTGPRSNFFDALEKLE